MKYRKRYSKWAVVVAMMQGVFLGITAVGIIAFFLIGMNGKFPSQVSNEKITTSGPVKTPDIEQKEGSGETLSFFAKQHGVFSSSEAAATFIANDPSLSKAAIIKANEQFYVWSAVGMKSSEIEVSEYEGTFRKPFQVRTDSCTSSEITKLVNVLTEVDITKIKSLASSESASKTEGQASEFSKNMAAITAFTSDLRIIRLHLLSHYSNTESCLKIEF